MKDTIEVQTEVLGVVKVRKLALKEYAGLLKVFTSLFPKFQALVGDNAADMKNEDFIALLPVLIDDAFPELMGLVAGVTDKSADEVEKLDLGELIDIVAAALELNNFERVVSSVKKIMALRRASAPKNPVPVESPQKNG